MAKNKTAHSSKNDSAISWETLSRLASYVLVYRVKIYVIIASIIVSAIVQAASAVFLQSLVDSYILPLVGKHNQDWTPSCSHDYSDGKCLRCWCVLFLALEQTCCEYI